MIDDADLRHARFFFIFWLFDNKHDCNKVSLVFIH
uniref:Uncharacterized protein n=1 Tax=Human betaherpesvirus 6 TaxID=10368 RepID=A0A5P9S5N3_9BETA|nr:hypothetical protein [Human betaherpesvirus 6]QFV47803.1 hypothetical protein [Human betaherpesvirus 6]QFV49805.1 hypothetical protein [Human betaherpesvirus 6]QFX16121.1 hypothetical protein [Human betaherpesvirus 6]QFX43716.1 hypothetical protein [Human betaherpesvirus 6]